MPDPKNYVCLHARTESDWFKACCKHLYSTEADTSDLSPEKWKCGEHTEMECYKSPSELVSYLRYAGLSDGSSIWVSSGGSYDSLKPLRDAFDVHSTVSKDSHVFMDYRLAMTDKNVCSGANRFIGMYGSSFSNDLYHDLKLRGGNVAYYSRLEWRDAPGYKWKQETEKQSSKLPDILLAGVQESSGTEC